MLREQLARHGRAGLALLLCPEAELAVGVPGDGGGPGLGNDGDRVHRVVVGAGELAGELESAGVVLVGAETEQDGHLSSSPLGSAISSGSVYVLSVALRRP